MGLFDFIGDLGTEMFRPLKNLTGIDASTSGVKFGTPFAKMTLGDAASLAGMFAAPGFKVSSIGDLGKLGTANLGRNLGTAGLLNQAGLGGFSDIGKWQTKDFMEKGPALMGALGQSGLFGGPSGARGTAAGAAAQAVGGGDRRTNALNASADALSPAGRQRTVDYVRGQGVRGARTRGRANAARLKAQGYGPATYGSATDAATSRANEAAGDFQFRSMGPEGEAAAGMGIARLLHPSNLYAKDVFDAEMQMMGNRIAAGRPPSDMERAFGVLGQLWGSGALDGMFKKPRKRKGVAEAFKGGFPGLR